LSNSFILVVVQSADFQRSLRLCLGIDSVGFDGLRRPWKVRKRPDWQILHRGRVYPRSCGARYPSSNKANSWRRFSSRSKQFEFCSLFKGSEQCGRSTAEGGLEPGLLPPVRWHLPGAVTQTVTPLLTEAQTTLRGFVREKKPNRLRYRKANNATV